MFKIYDGYSPRANAPSADYPYGSIRNESVPGANDGTPVDERLPNDYAGFDAALLDAAGLIADGNPDTALSSQRLEALKIVSGQFGNTVNYIQNHNFTIATTDDAEIRPDATPRDYPAGYQMFAGWYADDTLGVTGLTYENGVVNFTAGSIYQDVDKADGIQFLTGFAVSVAGTDCLPATTGVSFSTVGNSFRIVISSTAVDVFSVKFELSAFPTRHQPYGSIADFNDPIGTVKWYAGNVPPVGYLEVRARVDLSPWPKLAALLPSGIPETRGEFLRVWDNGRGVDVGRALLSPQGDSMRNITGGFGSPTVEGVATGSGVFNVSGVAPTGRAAGAGAGDATWDFDASRQVPTADEFRPRSVTFMLIIRAA